MGVVLVAAPSARHFRISSRILRVAFETGLFETRVYFGEDDLELVFWKSPHTEIDLRSRVRVGPVKRSESDAVKGPKTFDARRQVVV